MRSGGYSPHGQVGLSLRNGGRFRGVAIWIPMVLAVAWAAGQHWDIPALSIPAMERTHGLANSLAFVLGGLLAWWFIDRSGGTGQALAATATALRQSQRRNALLRRGPSVRARTAIQSASLKTFSIRYSLMTGWRGR